MAIDNVNVWSKIRDPRSNNVEVAGTFTAKDNDYLTPADIELSTIRSITMTPLNVIAGTQPTVAGSFELGDAKDYVGGSVNLSIILKPEGSVGTVQSQRPLAAGSHRIGFDAVGW